jgi:hypothetical protein
MMEATVTDTTPELRQLPLFDAIEIPLTQGQVTFVDPIDADLAEWRWYAAKASKSDRYYAGRSHGSEWMHRTIMSRVLGRELLSLEEVDHKDLDSLNNRRENLRLATHTQNQWNKRKNKNNTSGYKGVTFDKQTGKWRAKIQIGKVIEHLGRFSSIEEANSTYIEAAKRLHGEFAPLE